jgi:hypothetical protein
MEFLDEAGERAMTAARNLPQFELRDWQFPSIV